MAVMDLSTLTADQGTQFFSSIEIGKYSEASSAGDINGDGYEDFMFSERNAVGTTGGEGQVFVIYGRANMPAKLDFANLGTAGISIKGNNINHGIGISLSAAGDVNGDSFDDFIIGAAYGQRGESYLIFGGNALPSTLDLATLGSRGVTFTSATEQDRGGWSVSGAGDVNGDGFDDLIIGSPFDLDIRFSSRSQAYLIYGRANFPTVQSLLSSDLGINREIEGQPNAMGMSVSAAGDVNGDGFDDLIIGAPLSDATSIPRTDAGASYLIFGGPSIRGLDLSNLGSQGVKIIGADPGDEMGRSVSNAGDINGDGYDDLIIGARYADATNNIKSDAGESYVIFGRPVFPTIIDLQNLGSSSMTIIGTDANDLSGYRVSGAGDVNADGYDDILIGAPGADGPGNGRPFAGESYVVFGNATLPRTLNLAQLGDAGILILGAPFSGGELQPGIAESDAGDVNGDGFDDFIVGFDLIFGGNNFTSSVNQLGTASPETLTGTSAADDMVGGRGNDVVIGNGGADVLIGGQGDDVLAFSSLDFRKIDGGTGRNTLRFDGSGLGLKFSDRRLSGFQTVDLTGTGDNLLTVKNLDISRLPNSTLIVRGDAGDRVNYGTGWVQASSQLINGTSFYVFTQGLNKLKVQFGVTVNQAPVIAGFGGQVTASQDGPAVILDSDATVTDDSHDFAGGSLTVGIIDNSEVLDRIEIKNTGNAADQIGISGNTIRYGNKIIGTFVGTTTLLVTLNGNATPQSVQALLRNVTFRTTSVSTLTRNVQVVINDGDGVISNLPTKTVRVNASNVAPVLGNFGPIVTLDASYTSYLKIAPNATVRDSDSDFHGATLTLTALNGQVGDYFHVPFNAAIASAVGGEGATTLVITFNGWTNAVASMQYILRSISWGTNSRIEGQRTIVATVTDGDGGTSNTVSRTFNVIRTKVIPEVSGFPSSAEYFIANQVFRLAPVAILGVGRLTEFTGGKLVISNTQGATPSDRLQIVNEPGGIDVRGTNVFYGNVQIGSFTGGAGSTPLVVTLNDNAYQFAVRQLLRRISFRTADAGSTRSRTINTAITLEGITSTPQVTSMFVSFAPEILGFGGSADYQVGGPAVSFTGGVSGKATRNFAGGRLTFTVTKNGEAADLFSLGSELRPFSPIEVSGTNLTVGGVVFGTFSGGSGLASLVIRFNSNANSDLVNRTLNLVTWKSTAVSPSLNPRTITARLVDGDGLQSLPVTKQIFLS